MSRKKIKVGVLFGGRSAEHEVSLVSAASVMKNLDPKKYQVIPVGISKAGEWLMGADAHRLLTEGTYIPRQLRTGLLPEPNTGALIELNQTSSGKLQAAKVDVIFPVLHGTFGEDGTVQGLLELAGVPYVGAGILGSSVGMDKIAQKMIFAAAGLPIGSFIDFTHDEWKKSKEKILGLCFTRLGKTIFVKPANSGSSIGISKACNKPELIKAINLAAKYDRRILAEKGIENAWEIECAVLGNTQPRASIAGQIISSNEFYDYDAKYVDGKSRAIIPAPLPDKVMRQVQDLSIKAFRVLDLAGMSRVDFLIQPKTWKIYLNEVNTIPGFTSISMYPKLWQASGMTYARLLDNLIQLALERAKEKNNLRTSYKPKSQWYQ